MPVVTPTFASEADAKAYATIAEKWEADPAKWDLPMYGLTQPGTSDFTPGVLVPLAKLAEIAPIKRLRDWAMCGIKKAVMTRLSRYEGAEARILPEDIMQVIIEMVVSPDFFTKPYEPATAQKPSASIAHAETALQFLHNDIDMADSRFGVNGNGNGANVDEIRTENAKLRAEIDDLRAHFKRAEKCVNEATVTAESAERKTAALNARVRSMEEFKNFKDNTIRKLQSRVKNLETYNDTRRTDSLIGQYRKEVNRLKAYARDKNSELQNQAKTAQHLESQLQALEGNQAHQIAYYEAVFHDGEPQLDGSAVVPPWAQELDSVKRQNTALMVELAGKNSTAN